METTWIDVINGAWPVIGALGGAFIGAYFTNKNQKYSLERQKEIDDTKEKREKLEERYSIYNIFLKVDGENYLVTHSGGPYNEFGVEDYQEEIRPILYSKFHLLHQDVADIVLRIDNKIAECSYYEEITKDQYNYLCDMYFDLRHKISAHMDEGRKELLMIDSDN
ncbi:hypothetical protein GCM10008931_38780 [Oceanobacillus oncorhynchi subsp. oncorhynchi]|uniref:hypothetical protein n=1 Tax=Oceanobacillus oncorhynchi TaxID=545501 RepID=UPI0031D26A76